MSTSFERTTSKASATMLARPPVIFCARAVSLSATCVIWMARPARRLISSALRCRTSQVPPPTVPMPSRPTLIGFIALQPELEVLPDAGPFGGEHAVHHGVANGAVAARRVVADDAVLLRAEGLDGFLRAEIEIVGAQADDLAAQFFKTKGK